MSGETKLTRKAAELLRMLNEMEPGSCLHTYDRVAFNKLHDLGLADWQPRGWAGIGIHITDAGRAHLQAQPLTRTERFTGPYSDAWVA